MTTLAQNVIPTDADDAIRLLRTVSECEFVSRFAYNRCLDAIEEELKELRSDNTMTWSE